MKLFCVFYCKRMERIVENSSGVADAKNRKDIRSVPIWHYNTIKILHFVVK